MTKHILAIGHNDRVRVNPDYCPHENVVTVQTGYQYTIAGEATDNMRTFTQCLDCGYVQWDNGTWHKRQQELGTRQIPF
jgi:uncharacterized protein with PIN domain